MDSVSSSETVDVKQGHRPRSRSVVDQIERFAAVYLLIGLIIAFSLYLPNTFAQFRTAQTLLATQAVAGIVALAAVFPLAARDFDLSIGAIAGMTSLVAAELNGPAGWAAVPTIVVCALLGAAIGGANGFLVGQGRIDPFIATLAVATILEGV